MVRNSGANRHCSPRAYAVSRISTLSSQGISAYEMHATKAKWAPVRSCSPSNPPDARQGGTGVGSMCARAGGGRVPNVNQWSRPPNAIIAGSRCQSKQEQETAAHGNPVQPYRRSVAIQVARLLVGRRQALRPRRLKQRQKDGTCCSRRDTLRRAPRPFNVVGKHNTRREMKC